MPDEEGGINFASEDDFDRMRRAVRLAEQLDHDDGIHRPGTDHQGGLHTCVFKITGAKESTGVWPAVGSIKYIPETGTTITDDYEAKEEVRAYELNGLSYVKDKYYIGVFAGFFNGFMVVLGNAVPLDDYPYDGSYDDDIGGGGVSWESHVVHPCADGTMLKDVIEYTLTGFLVGRRVQLTLSMMFLEEDVPVLATSCKEVLEDVEVDVSVSVEVTCLDGVITATATPTVTVTKTLMGIRTVDCGSCE